MLLRSSMSAAILLSCFAHDHQAPACNNLPSQDREPPGLRLVSGRCRRAVACPVADAAAAIGRAGGRADGRGTLGACAASAGQPGEAWRGHGRGRGTGEGSSGTVVNPENWERSSALSLSLSVSAADPSSHLPPPTPPPSAPRNSSTGALPSAVVSCRVAASALPAFCAASSFPISLPSFLPSFSLSGVRISFCRPVRASAVLSARLLARPRARAHHHLRRFGSTAVSGSTCASPRPASSKAKHRLRTRLLPCACPSPPFPTLPLTHASSAPA